MGYSGRYHAASLAAVFIALAIGILIGIGLGDDIVTTASQELQDSLRSDLDEARERADSLQTDLDRERQFGERAYPALVGGRLKGRSVALVGLGDLPRDTAADAQGAIETAGAELGAVAVIRLPPDAEALAADGGRRFAAARRDPERLRELATAAGAQLASGGGPLLDALRGTLFSRFSGDLAGVDYVVFVRQAPEGLDAVEQERSDVFEQGLISGITAQARGVVGVERTTAETTTLGPFTGAGIATADHVDTTAGRVALVFALLGAGGDYGVREGADSLVPELLDPAAP